MSPQLSAALSSPRPGYFLLAAALLVPGALLVPLTCASPDPGASLLPRIGAGGGPGAAGPSAHAASLFGESASDLSDVAERILPAVVNVSSEHVTRWELPEQGSGPFFHDPFFEYFGRRFGPWDEDFGGGDGEDAEGGGPGKRPSEGRPRYHEQRQTSLGSGVIVRGDGVVVTNAHVVSRADEVRVKLSDGREFGADVTGSDERSDVAVLRLKDKDGKPVSDLPSAPWGDSDALRLAEPVLAVGSPFGLQGTVSLGIVSAKGRNRVGIVDYEDFIQTDAAINPGNSGGALVNGRGELVGINTAIASRSGGYQGIGFAIPSNMARSISDTLLAGKKVVRGWLGVRIQDLSEEMAEEFGARGRDGVLIGDVEEGSPASKAGVLRGDIVVGLDGHAVSDTAAFRNQIAAGGEGKKVQLSILRDGKEKKLDVTLGRLPEAEEVAVAGGGEAGEAGSGLLSGLQVKPLDARMRERLDLPESSQGLLITDVDGGSPAARVDLRPGDVILDCNKKPVGSVDELRKAAQGSGGRVLLRVRRGDASIYVLMTK